MNKFQKLAQLNQDIELLENAGKIKAANILHKKFIREAQEYAIKSAQELMNEIFLTSQNPTNEYNDLIAAYNANLGSYSEQDKAYIAEAIKRANKQRSLGNFSTSVQAPNPTVPGYSQAPVTTTTPTFAPVLDQKPQPANPIVAVDYKGRTGAYEIASPSAPVPATPAVQQPTSPVNSDTSNINEAMESMYAGVNQASEQQSVTQTPKVNEQQLYMSSLNEIIQLYKTKSPEAIDAAEQIYVNTYTQLTNQTSKKLFAQQIQRLRNQYNTARLKGQR
jgi:hypothetical protein